MSRVYQTCLHVQTFASFTGLYSFIQVFPCAHFQIFVRISDYSCALVQKFVHSLDHLFVDASEKTDLLKNRSKAILSAFLSNQWRSQVQLGLIRELWDQQCQYICATIRHFVRSCPDFCAFIRLLMESCPGFFAFIRPLIHLCPDFRIYFSVPKLCFLIPRQPRAAFNWIWAYR